VSTAPDPSTPSNGIVFTSPKAGHRTVAVDKIRPRRSVLERVLDGFTVASTSPDIKRMTSV